MRIALGTNYFGSNKRQGLAKQTHIKLTEKFPNVKLYDVQFEDDTTESSDEVTLLKTLKRSSLTLFPEWDKKIPFVNDIMSSLADLDVDYFIYTNSDILLSDRLIKHIIDVKPDALACSRLDIHPIDTLKDDIIPLRWEIAGFDTFVFKKEWFIKNKFLFEDFFIGRPAWDHHYAGLVKMFGGNYSVGNKNPAFCMHIWHGAAAMKNDNAGYTFNMDQLNNSKYRKYTEIWDNYCINVLIPNRQPAGLFLNEIPNESVIEKEYFDNHINLYKSEIDTILQ